MPITDRSMPMNPSATQDSTERLLSVFKRGTLLGDPLSIYQTILLCNEHGIGLPDWLAEHLLELIASYHLGNKPSWKGAGMRPLIVIRKRFEHDVKRRAVMGVRAWVEDRRNYQSMPTKCIHAWNDQDYRHSECQTDGDVLDFASLGLRNTKLQTDGPVLKCSARTLRRVMEAKGDHTPTEYSSRIASVFGLTDPDTYFGFDAPLKPNLK